jgi:hypothetical protein
LSKKYCCDSYLYKGLYYKISRPYLLPLESEVKAPQTMGGGGAYAATTTQQALQRG